MSLFGQLVRTVVNVAALPVDAVVDGVMLMADASDGKLLPRSRRRLDTLKREADDPPRRG